MQLKCIRKVILGSLSVNKQLSLNNSKFSDIFF